jgi:ADP-heptose:LPS heptosyltransferase
MGFGDWVIAAGLAKGPASRGRRAAFGDGTKIRHDFTTDAIMRYSPHIVWPHESLSKVTDAEWIHFYKGNRIYNKQVGDRWIWNYEFKVQPGEFFFSTGDQMVVDKLRLPKHFIVVEPHCKRHIALRGGYLANKEWKFQNYQEAVNALWAEGHKVVQFVYGSVPRLRNAYHIETLNFRSAAAILARASAFIGAEGGMHHAAAALNVPGVTIFGGWLPPAVLGYDTHINLTGGETEACGLLKPCAHCAAALQRITPDEVIDAAHAILKG